MSSSGEGHGRLIVVGRVAGAFGVRGEVRLTAYTADPMTLPGFGRLLHEDGSHALTVRSARPVKDGVICRVAELDSKEAADAMRGTQLFVPRSALPEPEEEEYYLADLIGLVARDPADKVEGRIKAVHDFGAGDILEIDPGDGRATFLIPFTRDAVPEVRPSEGIVVIVRPVEIGGEAPEPGEDAAP